MNTCDAHTRVYSSCVVGGSHKGFDAYCGHSVRVRNWRDLHEERLQPQLTLALSSNTYRIQETVMKFASDIWFCFLYHVYGLSSFVYTCVYFHMKGYFIVLSKAKNITKHYGFQCIFRTISEKVGY